jgi:hypothetical protein
MKTVILFLVVALGLVAIPQTRATTTFSELTPTRLNGAGFDFVFTTERLADGKTKFRVVITENTAKFNSSSSTELSTVEITEHSRAVRDVQRLDSQRNGNSLVCTFTVDSSALTIRDRCFVFSQVAETVLNGKVVQMPSKDFAYARLQDFARP